MKPDFNSRRWHIWISIVLALPIFIVAVTAVFIAHKKRLGTEEIKVAAGWLPGYRGEAAKAQKNELRAAFTDAAGTTWLGANGGLYRIEGDLAQPVPALAGVQVRALAEAPWGLVAAAKNGIWLRAGDGEWQRVHKGDAWSAAARPDGSLVVALKDTGLVRSSDGKSWQADSRLNGALAALPAEAANGTDTITLGKLVMDLHTGKAFFGKEAEWVWIDLVGLAMSLLALTGVWMWWRAERRKAALRGA